MPRTNTQVRSTECDIKLTPELRMLLLDEGIEVGGAFYWTIHGKVAFVGKAGPITKLVLADSPVEAIQQAARELTGGL